MKSREFQETPDFWILLKNQNLNSLKKPVLRDFPPQSHILPTFSNDKGERHDLDKPNLEKEALWMA